MLQDYRKHTDFSALAVERAKTWYTPLPLNAGQTSQLCELLKNPPPQGEAETLMMLWRDRAALPQQIAQFTESIA